MAKFSNVKVGDKLWSIQLGDCEVTRVSVAIIECRNGDDVDTYKLDGKYFGSDVYPSLYWNNPNIVDEKPFNLKEYLGDKLKPKRFRIGECNFCITYLKDNLNPYDYYTERNECLLGTLYFHEDNIREVVETLNSRKIELSELMNTLNELNVLWNI